MKVISFPPIAKFVFKSLKKNVFRPFQISFDKIAEQQDKRLRSKLERMERTKIGKKLGVCRGIEIQNLPVVSYDFYEPFFSSPSQGDLMYPLEDYVKVRTSGTSGKEKWFIFPQSVVKKAFRETAIPALLSVFHDGEKIRLEYKDNYYVNVAPRPFIGGTMLSEGSSENPFFNFVPNVNLSYDEKIEYFIRKYEKINGAVLLASAIISKIKPAIGKSIRLKGLVTPDTIIGEMFFDEITEFANTTPRAGYGSTETFICSIPSVEYPLGFFFDWRRGTFEFMPIENGETENDRILQMNEVHVGEIYQLVYTDFETELTRYDTKDSFKCVAKSDDIIGVELPIFKFQSRMEKTISISNFTRISEEELIRVFKTSKISYVDFTARAEIDKGMEYLAIYIELSRESSTDEIKEVIHKELYVTDRDYKELVDFFDYIPIKIYMVPKGVFTKYLGGKLATIAKVDRINMTGEEFKRLNDIIEKSHK